MKHRRKKKKERKRERERKKNFIETLPLPRIRQIAWRSIVPPSASLQFPSPSSEQKRLQRFQFTLRRGGGPTEEGSRKRSDSQRRILISFGWFIGRRWGWGKSNPRFLACTTTTQRKNRASWWNSPGSKPERRDIRGTRRGESSPLFAIRNWHAPDACHFLHAPRGQDTRAFISVGFRCRRKRRHPRPRNVFFNELSRRIFVDASVVDVDRRFWEKLMGERLRCYVGRNCFLLIRYSRGMCIVWEFVDIFYWRTLCCCKFVVNFTACKCVEIDRRNNGEVVSCLSIRCWVRLHTDYR